MHGIRTASSTPLAGTYRPGRQLYLLSQTLHMAHWALQEPAYEMGTFPYWPVTVAVRFVFLSRKLKPLPCTSALEWKFLAQI